MRFSLRSNSIHNRGFTMVDVMGAMLVVGLAFAGIFAANTRAMSMVKSAKQVAVASKCLQQRIEQIRNYNWTQVTDSQALQNLYAIPPLPAVELPGFSEQVTICDYVAPIPGSTSPTAPGSPWIKITRDVNGVVTLVEDAPNLVDNSRTVRVDVQILWPGPNGVVHTRQTAVIIANGGIGR
jgi:type II secretory pathway pseudopilin PulG